MRYKPPTKIGVYFKNLSDSYISIDDNRFIKIYVSIYEKLKLLSMNQTYDISRNRYIDNSVQKYI